MAYDEELAERVRGHLGDVPVEEKKMFGGLAFLVGGNMAVGVSGQGGLLVRCDPADTERLIEQEHVSRMEMGKRTMTGWLRVTAESVEAEDELARWVGVGVDFAGSLPPK
jgi:TfoX/Sxy family transcriptional regulator of competence genes